MRVANLRVLAFAASVSFPILGAHGQDWPRMADAR